MIGNDQDQGAAAERVGEVGERRVCDHDGDVGEKPGARKKKKKKCMRRWQKKIDHASICHGLARQCSWRYDTISARMATQL